MSVVTYIDLGVWKEARSLVKVIYNLSKSFPISEQYGITSQLRRAAVSVPSNIAEGCGRNSSKETIYFLHISRGSLYEVESLIYLSFDQEYISEKDVFSILEQITLCKKLLNGFISYYEKK